MSEEKNEQTTFNTFYLKLKKSKTSEVDEFVTKPQVCLSKVDLIEINSDK